MMLLLIGLGCGDEAHSAPYAGIVRVLDTNRDAQVSAAEYAAAAPPVAPAFAEVDLDGDGALSRNELAALTRRVDPANYDPHLVPSQVASRRQQGEPPKRGGAAPAPTEAAPGSGFNGSGPPLVGGADGAGLIETKVPHARAGPRPRGEGPTVGNTDARAHELELFREAVQFETEEVLARDPAAAVPSERALRAALDAGAGSAERTLLLLGLRAEVERVGLRWPPHLTP